MARRNPSPAPYSGIVLQKTSRYAILSAALFVCTSFIKDAEKPAVSGGKTRAISPCPSQILQRPQHASPQNLSSDQLYVLYLENTGSNPQLYQLLGDKKRKEKVVFQLYIEKPTQTIGLLAFPGRRIGGFLHANRGEFVVADTIKLRHSKVINDSINNREVVLGDLQLEEKDVDSLRKYMVEPRGLNISGAEFILFVPTIKQNPETGLYYVYYEIKRDLSLPGNKEKLLEATLIADTNPSPPRPPY